MQTGAFWDLEDLSDNDLLQGLHVSVGSKRRAIAQVVAHLAEVEERRLALKACCSSLFDYCLRRLGLLARGWVGLGWELTGRETPAPLQGPGSPERYLRWRK